MYCVTVERVVRNKKKSSSKVKGVSELPARESPQGFIARSATVTVAGRSVCYTGAADLHHSTSACHCPITHAKYNNIALTREESWPSTLVHKEKHSCTLPTRTIHVLTHKDVQSLAKISQQAALHSKCMLYCFIASCIILMGCPPLPITL